MADLATLAASAAGGVPNLAAVDVAATVSGDTAATGDGVFLYANNAGGASRTITVATPRNVGGLAIADATLVVPAAAHGIIPLPTRLFGPRATITYDAITSLTVAVFRLAE